MEAHPRDDVDPPIVIAHLAGTDGFWGASLADGLAEVFATVPGRGGAT